MEFLFRFDLYNEIDRTLIMNHTDKITVVGLGYVGLPLAVEFAKKFMVVGYDINQKRVDELRLGEDKTLEVESEELKAVLVTNASSDKGLFISNQTEDIADSNIYIITVPTPTDELNKPVFTPLIKSSENVGKLLKKDDIVIYESTVYPGVTEDICVPILEAQSGLTFNSDFFAGYSPERINPGDKKTYGY